jgi:hypothetical protein
MPSNWYWFAGIGLLILIMAFVIMITRGDGTAETPEKLPYRRRQSLLTQSQRNFFGLLKTALRGREVFVFAKLPLTELLVIPKETENAQEWFNKLQGRYADFVVCNSLGRILLAIELDETSPQQGRGLKRDKFLEQALGEAGLPSVRVPVAYVYDINEIVRQVDELMNAPEVEGKG